MSLTSTNGFSDIIYFLPMSSFKSLAASFHPPSLHSPLKAIIPQPSFKHTMEVRNKMFSSRPPAGSLSRSHKQAQVFVGGKKNVEKKSNNKNKSSFVFTSRCLDKMLGQPRGWQLQAQAMRWRIKLTREAAGISKTLWQGSVVLLIYRMN